MADRWMHKVTDHIVGDSDEISDEARFMALVLWFNRGPHGYVHLDSTSELKRMKHTAFNPESPKSRAFLELKEIGYIDSICKFR